MCFSDDGKQPVRSERFIIDLRASRRVGRLDLKRSAGMGSRGHDLIRGVGEWVRVMQERLKWWLLCQ